jgi:predicted 3-demethylubiquinone-9 3-methyltransferase (glyoxalase superfamily)
MPKMTPFPWFDTTAEEAMWCYVSLSDDSAINDVMRQGPDHRPSEAFSFVIDRKDQAEVDHSRAALTAYDGAAA